jgi:uncharacterized LabA/DUF88 family protein
MEKKVAMYIDGFNFYYAIRNQLPDDLIGLGWCDFRKLAEVHFLKPGEVLDQIRYFTAPVSAKVAHDGEEKKQALWLSAIKSIEKLTVRVGLYKGGSSEDREEKMTDVNIAVELILDAHKPTAPDKAIIISGDLDLFPAANAIANRIGKKVAVEFRIPPGDDGGFQLKTRCKAMCIPCLDITKEMLFHSRLPERIEHNGKEVFIAPEWVMPKSTAQRYGWF